MWGSLSLYKLVDLEHTTMSEITSKYLPQVGDVAPDFDLPSIQGGMVRLSGYTGRKVVIFMWASW